MPVAEVKPEAKTATAPAAPRPAPSTALALQEDIYESEAAFVHAQRVSASLGASSLVPDSLRKNPADVLTALGLARAMKCHPLLVMQSIFFVGGKAGWESKFMIARANQSGAFRGRIRWAVEGKGTDDLSVTAFATDAETGELVEATCDMAMARAEGWTKNVKYKSMPDHMLKWRSAAFLIRLHCPEVMFGLPIADELEDMGMRDVTPVSPVRTIAAEALGLHRAPQRSDFTPTVVTAEEAAKAYDEAARQAEEHERAMVPIVGTVDVDAQQRAAAAEEIVSEGDAAESASTLARLLSVLPDLPDVAALAEWKASVANERASLTDADAGTFATACIEREKRLAAKVRK